MELPFQLVGPHEVPKCHEAWHDLGEVGRHKSTVLSNDSVPGAKLEDYMDQIGFSGTTCVFLKKKLDFTRKLMDLTWKHRDLRH